MPESNPEQQLIEAVKAIVRAEINPEAVSRELSALSWQQKVVSVILISDVILAIQVLPSALIAGDGAKFFLGTILPWLTATVFAVSYDRMKDHLTQILARRWFQVSVLLCQFALIFLLIPFFKIEPHIYPENAVICIDGKLESGNSFKLRLGSYEVSILSPGGSCGSSAPLRKYNLGLLELLSRWNQRPVWTSLQEYPLSVAFSGGLAVATELIVERLDDDFDPDFLKKVKRSDKCKVAQPRKLVLLGAGNNLAITQPLIPGSYRVQLKKGDKWFGPQRVSIIDKAVEFDLNHVK